MLHRKIPALPARPHVHPLLGKITRSYPVGRESFLRACQCEMLELSITAEEPVAKNVRVSLMTNIGSRAGASWPPVLFERVDEKPFICRVTPQHPGLHSFRAEFSL